MINFTIGSEMVSRYEPKPIPYSFDPSDFMYTPCRNDYIGRCYEKGTQDNVIQFYDMSSKFNSYANVTMISISDNQRKVYHYISVSDSFSFRHDLISRNVSGITCYSASYNIRLCHTDHSLHIGTPTNFQYSTFLLTAIVKIICAFTILALIILFPDCLPI